MNVLPETDKQVGAILEAIREVSPQVVEQAVTYYRVLDAVWLVALLLFVGVLVRLTRFCIKKAEEREKYYDAAGWWICTWVVGIVACVFSAGCICVAGDLLKAHYAPDYYAAECLIDLARSALGGGGC
jgi:uncharacterized membrane protein